MRGKGGGELIQLEPDSIRFVPYEKKKKEEE